MLKQSASSVLASFRPSTYPRGYASALHSLRPCWTACLSILRECAPVAPYLGTIEVLLCQNGFSAACEAGNCCYRSFASVASNIFILLRMFSCPASPGHRRADRQARWSLMLEPVRHCLRDEAKEVLPDARPQAWKNRRRIRWNTLRIFLSRERRRCLWIVCRSRMALLGQTPRTSQRGTDWNPQWTGLSL